MKIFKTMLSLIMLILSLFAFNSCEQAPPASSSESALKQEIEALKLKVNSQAELISSLLAGKENDIESDKNEEINQENITQNDNLSNEFEYVKENGGITITKYNGKQTSIRIPERIENLPVLKIAKNAFAETKVKSVTLPSGCHEIDWFAFYGCHALTTVYISEKVTQIGYAAFDGCSKRLTRYCPSGSYAESYAKSFGFTYSSTN